MVLQPTVPIMAEIEYRPPFRYDLLLEFLSYRAIRGVEVIRDGSYSRTVRLDSFSAGQTGVCAPEPPVIGCISVADDPGKRCLRLTVSPELTSELPAVIDKTRRLFDTDCSPQLVEKGLVDFHERIPQSHIPGIRIPCCFDGFEMAVRAILGQQVTVKAANTIAGRLAAAFGTPVALPTEGLTTAFPPPSVFCAPDAAEKLGSLGVVRQRAKAICSLAEALCAGVLELHPGADIEQSAGRLLDIPGIGDWTVQYLLMRAFDFTDAFPATDYGVRCAFPNMKEKALRELSLKWSPWRSYAVMSLWCTPHG